jgi:hypothetical protein
VKLNSTGMTAKQSASGVNIVCASSDLKHAEWEERIARLAYDAAVRRREECERILNKAMWSLEQDLGRSLTPAEISGSVPISLGAT